jgi:replication-associated recombination protein RarA
LDGEKIMYQMTDRQYELISAMQKCIRRGMEKEAGRFAFELCDGGCAYVAFNRILITAHEDVGLANPECVTFVMSAIEQAKAFYKIKNDGWRLPLANSVLALSRSVKSREADHFQCVCCSENKEGQEAIPDFALDKHTHRGKAMGRSWDHFFAEGAKLDHSSGDIYQADAQAYWKKSSENKSRPNCDLFDK